MPSQPPLLAPTPSQHRFVELTTLLSAEQSEILHLVAQGKSASAIAEELGISNSTVRTRLTDLREKFGALSLACGVSALRSS